MAPARSVVINSCQQNRPAVGMGVMVLSVQGVRGAKVISVRIVPEVIPPSSCLGRPRSETRDPPHHRLQYPADRIAMMLDEAMRLGGIDPDPVAVRALIENEVLPFAADQIVSTGGAFHEMGASLGGEALVAGGFPLLADQVGFPAGEILVFVAVETASVRHGSLLGGFAHIYGKGPFQSTRVFPNGTSPRARAPAWWRVGPRAKATARRSSKAPPNTRP